MDTCVACGLTSSDATLFTGRDPVVCIPCHLELLDEDRSLWQEVHGNVPRGWKVANEFAGMRVLTPDDEVNPK